MGHNCQKYSTQCSWLQLQSTCFWQESQTAFPFLLNDKLPEVGVSNSEVVAGNLSTMHAARKQFIVCESSEKLGQPLHYQVRTSIA